MAPTQALDARPSVPSPLTASKKENSYSQLPVVNEQTKSPKKNELSRINESSNDSQPDPKGSYMS